MAAVPESQQQYGSLLTIAGENAEAQGIAQNKQSEFLFMAIGDANDTYMQPSRTQTTLINELHRIAINSMAVSQPTHESVPVLKVEAVLPDEINDLVIREFAIVATFDNTEYLHAVGNCARIYVPPPANNGNVHVPVVIEMYFAVTSVDAIVMIDVGANTATQSWVNDKIQLINNSLDKIDTDNSQAIIDQSGKNWFIGNGFLVTQSGSTYTIKSGVGYIGGYRIELKTDELIQVPNKPSFIYIDAYRSQSALTTEFSFVVTANEITDYDDADVQHYVCKIAQILRTGTCDKRVVKKGNNYTTGTTQLVSSIKIGTANENKFQNPVWYKIADDDHIYSLCAGSYHAADADHSVLDIINFDSKTAKLISSTVVGEVGVQVRAIENLGSLLYLMDWGGNGYIYDAGDKSNPKLVSNFTKTSVGGVQMLHIFDQYLFVPTWSGFVDIFSIVDQTSPRKIKTIALPGRIGSAVQMIKNGDYIHCICYSTASEHSLFCLKIVDDDVQLVSSTAIPELVYARYGIIDNNILYAGGYHGDSRLCAIDVTNPKSPVLIKKFDFNLSALPMKIGNKIMGLNGYNARNDWVEVDISDFENGRENILDEHGGIQCISSIGKCIFGFRFGTPLNLETAGAQNAYMDFYQYRDDSLVNIDNIKGDYIKTNKLQSNLLLTNELKIGNAGLLSKGLLQAPKSKSIEIESKTIHTDSIIVQNLFVCSNFRKLSLAKFGNLNTATKIFKFTATRYVINAMFKLKIFAHENQGMHTNGKSSLVEYIIAGYLMASSAPKIWIPHFAPSELNRFDHRDGVNVNVSIVQPTSNDEYAYIAVTSSDLSVNESLIMIELDVLESAGNIHADPLIVERAC